MKKRSDAAKLRQQKKIEKQLERARKRQKERRQQEEAQQKRIQEAHEERMRLNPQYREQVELEEQRKNDIVKAGNVWTLQLDDVTTDSELEEVEDETIEEREARKKT